MYLSDIVFDVVLIFLGWLFVMILVILRVSNELLRLCMLNGGLNMWRLWGFL